jgi:hypothetical protein
MRMKSSFTAEELADAFRYFDVEMDIIVDDDGEVSTIEGSVGDFIFEVFPLYFGPFYEEAIFEAFAPVDDDPIGWSTDWNQTAKWTTATPWLDEEDKPMVSDGAYTVQIKRQISFYGGIHPEALKVAAGQFLLELLEMFGIEVSEDDSEEDIDLDAPVASHDELTGALLRALDNSPERTAKQLAAAVDQPKNVVNSTLYNRPDLFRRKHATPPLWSKA